MGSVKHNEFQGKWFALIARKQLGWPISLLPGAVKTSLSRQTIGTGILLQQAQHTI
jgi:hypothetical protein